MEKKKPILYKNKLYIEKAFNKKKFYLKKLIIYKKKLSYKAKTNFHI